MQKKKEYSFKDKLDIALDYSKSNLELAKKIVSGAYNDAVAIKTRFKNEGNNLFGLVIIYASIELKSLIGIESCVSPSSSIYNNKPFEHWKSFEETIRREFDAEAESDKNNSINFKNQLILKFQSDKISRLLTCISSNNYDELTGLFNSTIAEILASDPITNQIESEEITSVDFEIASEAKITFSDEPEETLENVELKEDSQFAGNVVLIGKAVLSPVRGKEIKKLTKGDYIKVLITEKTRKAINIATKLEAYKDNEMQPIVSEVESYKRTENGHEIYTILAPYILLKINEEEDIKVATVNSLSDVLDEKRSKRGLIIGLAIFLIVLIVIIAILSNLK